MEDVTFPSASSSSRADASAANLSSSPESNCFLLGQQGNSSCLSLEATILMCTSAGLCSFVTIVGNLIVILSFVINKNLRNFSNYLILSLAVSDLTIGAFSMNVFTTYTASNNSWILGSAMCKAWLTVDYTASNASAMNLLVICCDRYLAITKPVKYRKWCTPKRAGIAVAIVWGLSFFMWAPAIVLWDLISEGGKIPENLCYIPFINDNAVVTIVTIVIAFYFPALLMCMLYQRVIYKLKKRRHGMRTLIHSATSSINGKRSSENTPTSPDPHLNLPVFDDETEHQLRDVTSPTSPVSEGLKKADASDKQGSQLLRQPANWFNNQTDVDIKNNIARASTLLPHRTFSTASQREEFSSFRRTLSFTGSHPSRQFSIRKSFQRSISDSSRESVRVARERRVTVLLKVILLCFIVLWLPYSLMVVVQALCRTCIVPAFAWNLGYWLCYLNSTVNPFCYGLCNENFRRTFKAIMTTKWWTKEAQKELRTGRKPGSNRRSPTRDTDEIKRRIKMKYRSSRMEITDGVT